MRSREEVKVSAPPAHSRVAYRVSHIAAARHGDAQQFDLVRVVAIVAFRSSVARAAVFFWGCMIDSRVVAIIPARYQSSRLPGKPLADIGGKPMIQHVYERVARAPSVSQVIVATDDRRIQRAVEGFGGVVRWTRATHRSGTDRVAEVAATLTDAVIVNVQGDVPFLEGAMIEACVGPLRGDPSLVMATVKAKIDDLESFHNPNVVKVVCDRQGNALYFSRSALPLLRDGAPDLTLAFKHIGLYAYRRDFLLTFAQLEPTPLERAENLEQLRALEWGYRIRVTEVPAASIEVDTPADLERARMFAGAAVAQAS